jgi:hypothetical protein
MFHMFQLILHIFDYVCIMLHHAVLIVSDYSKPWWNAVAKGGPESGLGRYDDYTTKHTSEEADNVFRVFARTKHYTKKEPCRVVITSRSQKLR